MIYYILGAWFLVELVTYVVGARYMKLGWRWPIDRVKMLLQR